MAVYRGDYRPLSEWGHLRVVCHACRGQAYMTVHGETGAARSRPVIIPGDGSFIREIMPGQAVTVPCPVCGEADEPGWLAGLQPPV